MGIGSYRHLVTLEHPAVVLDPPTWYCAVQPAGTQAMEGLAAFFIRGRFHPGIGLETQIVFEGRTFQVQAVNDLDERHREIQVTAVEVVGRGTTPSGTPVNVPPSIVEGPESTTIDAGDVVLLTVIAAGAAPLAYQWTKDGADLPGEIYQFLETGPIVDTAVYGVRVSNVYGSVTATATVTVRLTYQEQVIFDGASDYWPLDDPSGSSARNLAMANPGTISGGVTLNSPGVTADSKAMTFDATTGKILTATALTVPVTATIEYWFKQSVSSAGQRPALTIRPEASLFVGTNSNVAEVWLGGGLIDGPRNVRDNQWHHMVVVLTTGACAIYIDGALDISVTEAHGAHTGLARIAFDDTGTNSWLGSLQDVAIYPRALSAAEIAAHYALRVP